MIANKSARSVFAFVNCILIFAFTCCCAQQPVGSTDQSSGRDVHISGDTVSLRFKVYQYFPFIDVVINGVKGKVMFDTGAGMGLDINDAVVPLKNPRITGNGFAGSGQSFQTRQYDSIASVAIDQRLFFTNSGPIGGSDYSYMDNITSDILGLVGYRFFDGYLFKLDYRRRVIKFYKNTPERQRRKDFLKGEKVVGIISFESRKLVNHPTLPMKIGTDTLAVSFDTGQLGSLYLSDQLRQKWMDKGDLRNYDDAGMKADLGSFTLPGNLKTSPGETYLFTQDKAAAAKKAIGITEPNLMTLGYSFLSQYKTVWDYGQKRIYLLRP